jgi:hypothetical protein
VAQTRAFFLPTVDVVGNERRKQVRKVLLGLVLLAALAVPSIASANGTRPVICGTCDGGTGWSGCVQVTAEESGGVSWIAHWRHYLVVNYCKVRGTITSLGIAAHGCDAEGFASCSTGPAWLTSGGVGYGWASLEGHATYSGTLNGSPFGSTSVVHVNIPIG